MSTSSNTVCTPQVTRDFRLRPQWVRNTRLSVADAIDAYMGVYAGRDPALAYA